MDKGIKTKRKKKITISLAIVLVILVIFVPIIVIYFHTHTNNITIIRTYNNSNELNILLELETLNKTSIYFSNFTGNSDYLNSLYNINSLLENRGLTEETINWYFSGNYYANISNFQEQKLEEIIVRLDFYYYFYYNKSKVSYESSFNDLTFNLSIVTEKLLSNDIINSSCYFIEQFLDLEKKSFLEGIWVAMHRFTICSESGIPLLFFSEEYFLAT